jgi:hypothetical protein
MGCERSECPGTTEVWLVAWIGGAGIGVANGATRELTYGRSRSR